MYSIIVLSHGDLTYGLKDTMIMIAGEKENTYFVSFSPSDSVEEFEKKVKVIFHSIPKEYKILILTDLYGGTPNHIASTLRLRYPERIEVICGVNLPLLLVALSYQNMELGEVKAKLIEECRSSVKAIDINTDKTFEEDE